ncbi:Hypothetical protein NTJ_10605 [Nesidiocoris tenuis]|uniref:Secreted protein n=1 Tax=Nesidiocoris tenuis TaxID=355587 RepID=A0ABN7B046_9HEMI|nr:Hypothetical protein NTJ_10605 [Nesidiocoris tenuis]
MFVSTCFHLGCFGVLVRVLCVEAARVAPILTFTPAHRRITGEPSGAQPPGVLDAPIADVYLFILLQN